MALKNLFKPINKALQGHIKKVDKSGKLLNAQASGAQRDAIRDLIIEEQVNEHLHEMYYTNEWFSNTVQVRVQAYIMGNKGSQGHSMSPADANTLNTKILPIIAKKTKKHNTQKWWKKNLLGKNIVVASKRTGKPKRKDKRRAARSGYVEVKRGNKAGGALLVLHNFSPTGGTDANKAQARKLNQLQSALMELIIKESIKVVRDDPAIKKLNLSGRGKDLMKVGTTTDLIKAGSDRAISGVGIGKLHGGKGSIPRNPRGSAPGVGNQPENDGLSTDSDTTVRMINFLQELEDHFEELPEDGVGVSGKGTNQTALETVAREINKEFNAAYTIEGISAINLFGKSGSIGKLQGTPRYQSKDIVATKDINIRLVFGLLDQNALMTKADLGVRGQQGLDKFFKQLQIDLGKQFTNPAEKASMSIQEMAERGVFNHVAKKFKTSSGMPDMRFKVNKEIFRKAKYKEQEKRRNGINLLKAKNTVKKRTNQKLAVVAKTLNKKGTDKMKTMQLGTNPLALESILEKMLPKVVASKMTAPALVYRTGRFAESAAPVDVMIGPRGGIHIDYTYARDPYETFEPGNRQGSTYRDPRKIIGSSVREIAQSMVGDKFIRVRRR